MSESVENEELKKDLKSELDEIKSETDEIKTETDQILEDVEEIKEEIKQMASKDVEEENFKEKYYYLAAEMDNLSKRHSREKQNLIKFANEKVLSGLIDVLDNLDRTLDALSGETDEKIKNIVTGVDMVRSQFFDVLAKNGLEKVEALGKDFDPQFHEALSQQEVEGKKENEIIMEYQRGYVLNGRLLRAAKVVVAK